MPSAYPASYRERRSNNPGRGGSQPDPRKPRQGRYREPPRPLPPRQAPSAANDNIPNPVGLPKAANDNFPQPVGLPQDIPLPAKVARSLDRYFTLVDAGANAAGLFDLVANGQPRAYMGSVNGWSLRLQCAGFPIVGMGRQATVSCLTGQAASLTTTFLRWCTEWAYSNPSLPRYRQVRVWERASFPTAVPAPLWNPAFDPRLFPEYMPNPNTQAYPYWALPYRKPSIMPQSWKASYTAYPRVFPKPVAYPRDFPVPYASSRVFGWPTARRGQRPFYRPPEHTRNPPKPNERERKYRPGKVLMGVWAGVGTATEALDLLQLLYRSIPKKWRSKWHNGGNQHFDYWSQDPNTGKWKYNEPPPWIMAMVVFNNMHHVDVSKAVPNFVKMQASDKAYGAASKVLNKRFKAAYKATGRPFGYETGPVQMI